MLFAAEFEPAQAIDLRRSTRASMSLNARIESDGLQRTLCRVADISVHGALLNTYSPLTMGSIILLRLPIIGQNAATVVWSNDFEAGIHFLKPLGQDDFENLIDINAAIGGPRRRG